MATTELMKMATGLAARSNSLLRLALFAAMLTGCWWLWDGADIDWAKPNSTNMPVIAIGMVNAMAILLLSGFCGRWRAKRLPLALWTQMTRGGENIQLWTVLVWPLLIPAELAICAAVVGLKVLRLRLR